MAFDPPVFNVTEFCLPICNSTLYKEGNCPAIYLSRCSSFCLSFIIPPPVISIDDHTDKNQHVPSLVIIIVAILGAAFLLVSYYAIIVKYCSSWNISRRRPNPPQSGDTHEDFLYENQGPVVDHHIWFITTVGLSQSIINSISICKYNKGEGLVEGTECSVCLSEFEEDETLRLLPKCSHAFHPPCIDTWLRSHKNCPLCRAPIVSNEAGPPVTLMEPNFNSLGSGEELQVGNSESNRGLGSDEVREGGVGTEDVGELGVKDGTRDTDMAKEGGPSPLANCEFRVLSDLTGNHRAVEDGIQPMRRSVSMDLSSASMIRLALANFHPVEVDGSSASQVVQVKKSNLETVPRQGGGNPSIYKLMSSSSIGRSLQKGPVSMKRSFSCGGKFLLSKSGRSRSSILPL
ncbi:hypothetical protein HHK36_009552 [Tetracentron sinense]|uniref:RING-type E3 ubiquitin transferase n=1 Tax=Tetracentron sinense TaxID=13715 RepID=A0A834ZB27_TETSI|nr:hypothetical protein HHK36_009552 [Tetracentron sinense]